MVVNDIISFFNENLKHKTLKIGDFRFYYCRSHLTGHEWEYKLEILEILNDKAKCRVLNIKSSYGSKHTILDRPHNFLLKYFTKKPILKWY